MFWEKKSKKRIRTVYFIEVKSPSSHIFSRVPIPRLGTILLSTIIKEKGYKTKSYIEDIAEPDWKALKNANVVGISSITSTAPRALKLAEMFKKLNKIVVMGGSHFTFLPEEALKNADYVVRGEGEDTIVELLEHLETGQDLGDIKGLSFKKGGKFVHNPDRPLIENLDDYPIPDLGLVHEWNKRVFIPLATSRGCPFGCKFCSVIQMFGRKYRFKSIDRVIEEIKEVASRKAHIFFIDDNFTANKDRTKELLRRMIAENIHIEWSAQVRTDVARDQELVDLMVKTGCFTVYIGFESINPKTLKLYRKNQKVADIINCILVFKKAEIKIHGMLVFGGDSDDIKTIRETAKFGKEYDIDTVQFLMLTPLPGTPVFEELLQEGRLLHQDWEYYDAHHAVFYPKLMTPFELHHETLKAMQKFYSRRRFFSKLIKGDLFCAMVTRYGRKLLAEAFQNEEAYFKKIKEREK